MEILFELLWVVVQFFAELLLQVVFELLVAAGVRVVRAPFADRPPARAWLMVLGHVAAGAAAGWISVQAFPVLFISSPVARLANLLLTPIAAGATMAAIGAWRARRAKGLVGLDRFAYGFLFALAMQCVRLALAE